MTTRHEAYGGDEPRPFNGRRADLRGGEYLGESARPDLFGAGDIVTSVGGSYYYDPEHRIDGSSYVWSALANTWVGIKRAAR